MKLFAKELADGSVEFWVEAVLQATLPASPNARFEAIELAKVHAAHRKAPLSLEAVRGAEVSRFVVFPDGRVQKASEVAEEIAEPTDTAEGDLLEVDEGEAVESVLGGEIVVHEEEYTVATGVLDIGSLEPFEAASEGLRPPGVRRTAPWQRTLVLGAGLVLVAAAGFFSWRALVPSPDSAVADIGEQVVAEQVSESDPQSGVAAGGDVATEVVVTRSGDRSMQVLVTPTAANEDALQWSFTVGEQSAALTEGERGLVAEIADVPLGEVAWRVTGPADFALENVWTIQ